MPPLVAGFLAGAMLPPAFTWVTRVWAGDSVGGALDAALEYWAPRAPGLVLGAGIGAALGVTIGRAWGAFRAWIPAAAFALILGLAGAYAYAAYAT